MNTDKIIAEKIASEYALKKASKLVALKKLDRKARLGAEIFAYTFGIFFTLVFGTGMCFAMKVIGDGQLLSVTIGIVVGVIEILDNKSENRCGVIGILGVSINYPIYKRLLNRGKMIYGNDIIELAKEIAEE